MVLNEHNFACTVGYSGCLNDFNHDLFLVTYLYSCPNASRNTSSKRQYMLVKTDRSTGLLNRTNIAKELALVKSSKNMKDFLEKKVRWNVRLYDLESFGNSSVNMMNFSDEQLEVYDKNFKNLFVSDFCKSCKLPRPNSVDSFNHYLENYYVIFVILGLLSLFGNGIAIFHEIQTLIKQKNKIAKERNVYNMLVVNLCFADLLMAFYLIIFPIALKKLKPINYWLCDMLGVFSLLSMEVSVSILVIITLFRLYGIIYPYKRIHIKVAIALLVLVWIGWVIVASLPLFNGIIFAHEFTRVIDVTSMEGNKSFREPLTRISASVKNLVDGIELSDEPFSMVLHDLSKYKSNEVTLQLLNSFNLVNFVRDEVVFVNYYSPDRACTIEIFVNASNTATAYFSLSLLICNFAGFLFILVSYMIMLRNISASRLTNFFSCLSEQSFFKKSSHKSKKVKSENRQVYYRIFAVVVTDLVCGIPLCLLGFGYFVEGLFLKNCFVNQNFLFKEVAPLLVLILFPINSVINPYIYSFHLWKKFLNRFKQKMLHRASSTIHSASTQTSI